MAEPTAEKLREAQQLAMRQAQTIRYLEGLVRRCMPEYGTPNFCDRCSPKRQGYCSCEIASNE
jgi:hypothetical protein